MREKIYLKDFKRGKGVKILDLIQKITICTYSPNGNATFYDKECTDRQCKTGANRTPDDIYLIVKTYYPNATEKTIFNMLYKFLLENNNKLFIYRCSTIQKFVCFNNYNGNYNMVAPVFIEPGHLGMDIPDKNNRTINSLMKLFTN